MGWYLLRPPPLASNPNKPDLIAPLSNWTVSRTLPTAPECEKYRKVSFWLARDPNFKKYAEITARQKGAVFSMAKYREFTEPQKCIATDDPRLKEK